MNNHYSQLSAKKLAAFILLTTEGDKVLREAMIDALDETICDAFNDGADAERNRKK